MRDVGPEIVSFTAWAYDPRFGSLQREVRIQPEMWASGEIIYRVPPFTTLIMPPADLPPNRQAVFLEKTQSWIVVSDHMGEWWLDEIGRPRKIERLGDPRQWGYTRLGQQSEASA